MTSAFIDYASFDNNVQQCTDSLHYKEFKYILPSIGIVHRVRFMQAMGKKKDIKACAEVVSKAINLPDENFDRYAGYMLGRA